MKKISLLTALAAGTIFAVAPAHADGIRAHGDSQDMNKSVSSDADGIPGYRHDVRIDDFILKIDHFSNFDRDLLADRESDADHSMRGRAGVPKTAEWIWWLKSDKEKKQSTNDLITDDPIVPAPEPASLFLLGSGLLALGALRRRSNHPTPIS